MRFELAPAPHGIPGRLRSHLGRRLRRATLACAGGALMLVAMALPAGSAFAESVRFDGHRVVRVELRDQRELRTMLALSDDLWSHEIRDGVAEFRVSPEAYETLRRLGIRHQTMIEDVQAAIDQERSRLAKQVGGEGGVAGGLPADWFADFKDNAAIGAYLEELAALRPDLCTLTTIGLSLESRPIRALRIASGPGKPAVLFNGCQHAREWISPMVVMWLADRLVQGADSDPVVADLLERLEFVLVPVVNPDGYQFTWDENRLWRKNRRLNPGGTIGVDLNRNWGYEWGGNGSSGDPGSDTYRGPFAFSEPETQAMRDFFVANPQILATIDYHSFSQLVLWPWAWSATPTPDAPLYDLIGGEMISTITAVNENAHTGGPIFTALYPASGGSVDWTYGDRGALSFTVELRDTGQFGFILPPEQIVPTCLENFPAAMQLADLASRPGLIRLEGEAPQQVAAGIATSILGSAFDVLDEIDEVALFARVGSADAFAATVVAGGPGAFTASLPPAPCGAVVQWYLQANTADGFVVRLPEGGPSTWFESVAVQESTAFDDALEIESGWTVGAPGDSATAGLWVRVDPVGTSAQPENDHTPDGTICFVTGQGAPGGQPGAADVDGGTTTLRSPRFDASEPGSQLSYWRWYSNNLGASPNSDLFRVEVSGDDGATWTLLEQVAESATAWVFVSFDLSAVLPPTSTLRVRFVASDLGQGSLVEAAVDDVRLAVVTCADGIAGDLDRDGDVDGADLGSLLAQWGGVGGSADLDGDGAVGGADLGVLLANWGPR